MSYKYNFYYDESEHSRKISENTITAENYYDNFLTGIIGWKLENVDVIEKKYLDFEKKYAYRMIKGELKSVTIKNNQIKNGFASMSKDNVAFMQDFFNLFNDDIYIFFSISSKIEYIIQQLFQNYHNTLMIDIDSMKYSIIKAIVLYQPSAIINKIYSNTGEFIEELKKFLNDRISANKKNLPLKILENQSFSDMLRLLDDVHESFSIDWEYRIPFYGFSKYLDEMNIDEYSLKIDKEDKGDTSSAAQRVGLKNVEEEDSKNSFGVRWADMFVGTISKFMKAMHTELKYKSIDDGINKKLLGESWFRVNDNQLKLYKQLNYIIFKLNNAWYKSYAGLYSDDLIIFTSFISYMGHFESVSEIKKTDYKLHAEYVNSTYCYMLNDYFSRIHRKLPINAIKKTDKDFFIGEKGQKIYFDSSKQPILKLEEGTQIYDVLAVGVYGKSIPEVTILENGKASCYRIPNQLLDWANTCVSFANLGEKMFPSKVIFIKKLDQYCVDLL